MLIANFVYNNNKKINIGHPSFELNCGYHPYISIKDEVNHQSNSCLANKLATKLKNLLMIASKTYFMFKNFKNNLTSKKLSLGAMPQVKEFDSIINISKLYKIKGFKPSFLDHSEFYIMLGSKFTNLGYPKSSEFMIFFICYH